MLSGAVRARRPPSPPPSYHQSVPRFPPKEGHLDADERRAAASLGYGPVRKSAHASGGYNITSGEWKLLLVLVVIASAVRLFRISKPDSVVYATPFSYIKVRPGELTSCEHSNYQIRRSPFWQVRLAVHQDTIFRGCSPSTGQTAHHACSLRVRVRWTL